MKFIIAVLFLSSVAFAEDIYKQNQDMQNQKQAQDLKNAAALNHSNKQFEAEKNGTNFNDQNKVDFLKKLKKNQTIQKRTK
jgi:hypothetical protein